ncbi:MAG: hypothetical protein ACYS7Y_30140 [Planctomycetota bacterium]|jgi:hypothetical protein
MVRGLTSDEEARLTRSDRTDSYCIKLTVSSGSRYWCTDRGPHVISGDTYTHRPMVTASRRALVAPEEQREPLMISLGANNDADRTFLRSAFDNSQFGGTATVTIYQLIWHNGAWAAARTMEWGIADAALTKDLSWLSLDLGQVGLRPGPGLVEGSRSCTHRELKVGWCTYAGADTQCLRTHTDCDGRTGGSNTPDFGGFRYAPEEGETFQIGTAVVTTVGSPSVAPPGVVPPLPVMPPPPPPPLEKRDDSLRPEPRNPGSGRR